MAETKIIDVVPVVSASPDYSDGDVLGALMPLPLGRNRVSGWLQQVILTSEVDIAASIPVDVLIFSDYPGESAFTDNAALAVAVDDLPFLLAVVHLTDRIDLGTPVALQATGLALKFATAAMGSLWAVAVARGTINLAATDDVRFRFVVDLD